MPSVFSKGNGLCCSPSLFDQMGDKFPNPCLIIGEKAPNYCSMNGAEFIRKIQKVGKANGVPVTFDTAQGKGSHGTLWYGFRKTTVKDRKKELGAGLLDAMLGQLGLMKTDIR
jgi:mRNA interferase HicA